jgi:hypothetical protein
MIWCCLRKFCFVLNTVSKTHDMKHEAILLLPHMHLEQGIYQLEGYMRPLELSVQKASTLLPPPHVCVLPLPAKQTRSPSGVHRRRMLRQNRSNLLLRLLAVLSQYFSCDRLLSWTGDARLTARFYATHLTNSEGMKIARATLSITWARAWHFWFPWGPLVLLSSSGLGFGFRVF